MSKHKWSGFTLVEVALFLAVTAVLFVSIINATQGSIWQQRYFDSVQGYAEFWRSIYSQVANTQTVGSGDAEIAIYGKMVVFGENTNLQGEPINDTTDANYGQQIFVYDVVGKASGTNTKESDLVKVLEELDANVVVKRDENGKIVAADGEGEWTFAGEVTDYVPRWGAEIEAVEAGKSFKGSIAIVKHPRTGTINTLYYNETLQINEIMNRRGGDGVVEDTKLKDLLKDKWGNFKVEELDFCLNPFGYGVETDNRRDIRIAKNARNGSGVQIIDLDSEENRCRSTKNEDGE